MADSKLYELFGVEKPIIGMIHLAGAEDYFKRALEEIAIYEEEGVNGAIVENYYGNPEHVREVLFELSQRENKIKIGVNILPNEFKKAFSFARDNRACFIQLDNIAGQYDSGELDAKIYKHFRDNYSEILVLGGVWPKYYQPVKGSDLKVDLVNGRDRADAIVVTGRGTGKETPIEKIMQFRQVLGDYPLIIGAGLTTENAAEQLAIADGAIVGSFFKDGNTSRKINVERVRELMAVVRKIRGN